MYCSVIPSPSLIVGWGQDHLRRYVQQHRWAERAVHRRIEGHPHLHSCMSMFLSFIRLDQQRRCQLRSRYVLEWAPWGEMQAAHRVECCRHHHDDPCCPSWNGMLLLHSIHGLDREKEGSHHQCQFCCWYHSYWYVHSSSVEGYRWSFVCCLFWYEGLCQLLLQVPRLWSWKVQHHCWGMDLLPSLMF